MELYCLHYIAMQKSHPQALNAHWDTDTARHLQMVLGNLMIAKVVACQASNRAKEENGNKFVNHLTKLHGKGRCNKNNLSQEG